jgi:hypothetical protein
MLDVRRKKYLSLTETRIRKLKLPQAILPEWYHGEAISPEDRSLLPSRSLKMLFIAVWKRLRVSHAGRWLILYLNDTMTIQNRIDIRDYSQLSGQCFSLYQVFRTFSVARRAGIYVLLDALRPRQTQFVQLHKNSRFADDQFRSESRDLRTSYW